jgi:hypothetical protein
MGDILVLSEDVSPYELVDKEALYEICRPDGYEIFFGEVRKLQG